MGRGRNGMNGNGAHIFGNPDAPPPLLEEGMYVQVVEDTTFAEARVEPIIGLHGPEVRIIAPVSRGVARVFHVPCDLALFRLQLASLGQSVGEPGDIPIVDTPVPDDLVEERDPRVPELAEDELHAEVFVEPYDHRSPDEGGGIDPGAAPFSDERAL